MSTLLKQEFFKLYKKKSTFIIPIIIIFLMIAQAIVSKNSPDIFPSKTSIQSAFSGYSWFVFLLIIQASVIISMEFYHGTIKNILYRNHSRTSVINKWEWLKWNPFNMMNIIVQIIEKDLKK